MQVRSVKRLSDPSTSETLKKFLLALGESTKQLIRRCLRCTRPPPTDVGDADVSDNIVTDVEMLPTTANQSEKPKEQLSTVHETMTWYVNHHFYLFYLERLKHLTKFN